jgi:large subunit ribosomal protein L23
MRSPHEIIERPLLTEKSTDQAAASKFHFRVRMDANKIEIAYAVEALYSTGNEPIKVLAVNTMHVKGKRKRAMSRGGKPGYSPNWKKAIVTTDKPIVLFEGV